MSSRLKIIHPEELTHVTVGVDSTIGKQRMLSGGKPELPEG
jgi:hypothetical protein